MVRIFRFRFNRGYRCYIWFPLRIEGLIPCISACNFRNRRAGEATVRVPAFKSVSVAGDISLCWQRCLGSLDIAFNLLSGCNCSIICIKSHLINRFPLCQESHSICNTIIEIPNLIWIATHHPAIKDVTFTHRSPGIRYFLSTEKQNHLWNNFIASLTIKYYCYLCTFCNGTVLNVALKYTAFNLTVLHGSHKSCRSNRIHISTYCQPFKSY